jgi:hypothetical protein
MRFDLGLEVVAMNSRRSKSAWKMVGVRRRMDNGRWRRLRCPGGHV